MAEIRKKAARLTWLDIARGICILCMITAHQFDWSKRNRWFAGFTGSWFLVFFFFCSGLCYSDRLNFKDYTKKQFKKLILPYVAATCTYMAYRLYHGIWWDLPHADRIKSRLLTVFFALPIDVNNVYNTGYSTIGIGPIWFLVCMFFASLMYKCLYRCKNRNIRLVISVLLTIVAQNTQKYFTAPFTLQNAVIGCMFIALGDYLREFVYNAVEKIREKGTVKLHICSVLLFIFHCFVLIHMPGQLLNLGGNQYNIMSLASSFTGFVFLITLSVALEKAAVADEFLAFCGKESLGIVVLHDLDILMLRNWSMRGNSFLVGTILVYPFIIYLINRIKRQIKT